MELTIHDNNIAHKLDALIALLMAPKVALNHELWDAGQVAAYLRTSKQKFLRDIATKRTFPKARCVDPDTINATNKRWIASEVISWANSQRV